MINHWTQRTPSVSRYIIDDNVSPDKIMELFHTVLLDFPAFNDLCDKLEIFVHANNGNLFNIDGTVGTQEQLSELFYRMWYDPAISEILISYDISIYDQQENKILE